MSIYTKTGDNGETSMLCGKRVCKSCLEMEAIGEVDELNAVLGLLVEDLEDKFKKERRKIIDVQKCLFTIGANIAGLQTKLVKIPKFQNSKISKLEKWIDAMEKNLPKLKNFIIPGGSEEAAWSYFARTVCRRAERAVIGLDKKYQGLPRTDRRSGTGVSPAIKQYLNRLSDCLFVLGRWINKKSNVNEKKWN